MPEKEESLKSSESNADFKAVPGKTSSILESDIFQAILKQLLRDLVHVVPGYHGGCLWVSCLSSGVRLPLLFEGDLLH